MSFQATPAPDAATACPPATKHNNARKTMLSNLLFRLNQLITRWLYRDHKRRYKNVDPSDD